MIARIRRRAYVATLFIALALSALGITPAAAQEAGAIRADRFGQVFDRSGDAGKLVVRFLKLTLAVGSEDKSGDSAILVSPDGKTMLIDGGITECDVQVKAYLDALGITRLDAVVASHPHVDHIGGLIGILGDYEVGTVYMSEVVYTTGVYKSFMAAVKANGASVVYLQEGSTFSFGDSVGVTVYNPEPEILYYDGYPANSTQFVNDRSIVMKFVYGESSVLFMGDVYTSRELDLIGKYGDALSADVIKVGHHGSDTSSSKSFIRQVAPTVAVMMHDKMASLGVYKNYRKVGSAAYLSCIDGCVKVSADAEGILTVITQFDRASDFLK